MSRAEECVAVGLSGGLGNQMFQYATGRALSLRLKIPLILDLSWFHDHAEREYGLGSFAIPRQVSERAVIAASRMSQEPNLLRRLGRRFSQSRMGIPLYRERDFHFDPAVFNLEPPVYLDGYWQSEKYFSDFRDTIRQDFALRDPLSPESVQFLKAISTCDSIGLHVRRGDYITNPVTHRVHGVCSASYYQEGVNRIGRDLPNPRCFVFSDDPDWVRSNLKLPFSTVVVEQNGPRNVIEDLYLMSACESIVIANSSLSWWAAWLEVSRRKAVIAPKRWFTDPGRITDDLIPESWTRL